MPGVKACAWYLRFQFVGKLRADRGGVHGRPWKVREDGRAWKVEPMVAVCWGVECLPSERVEAHDAGTVMAGHSEGVASEVRAAAFEDTEFEPMARR